jgi:putative beta-barrel porin MtrB/PioB
MNAKLIPFLVGSLFAATAASAADGDDFNWSGSSISIGVRNTTQEGGTRNGAFGTSATTTAPFTGPEDRAKLNEYRDLSGGAIGTIDLMGSSTKNYVRFFGENLGYDDQLLNLRGGEYGAFKYQVFQDKMPHNLSWGALTPLPNPGQAQQLVPGAVPGNPAYPPFQNPATWNPFDYKLQRNVVGGNFDFTGNSPWNIRAGYNETTMDGVRPLSARLGTGSGNGLIEFGGPTKYKTMDFTLDGGYSVKKGSISVNFLNSRFTNPIDTMQFTNFYMLNGVDTMILPPDNTLNRVGLNGTLRDLPANSTLSVRGTWSKLTNSFGVTDGGLQPTSSASPPTAVGTLSTQPTSDKFNGEHETKTASLSYASNWGGGVDSKLFYNYYDMKNKSTLIEYAQGTLGTNLTGLPATCFPATQAPSTAIPLPSSFNCIGPNPNELFAYKKNDYGVDAGWRINQGNKLSGGLSALKIEREGRGDADETKEKRVWAEYKNTSVEDLSVRLKGIYLQRRSEIDPTEPPGTSPFSAQGPGAVQYYFRAYDVSNMNQPQARLVLNWAPAPLVDTSFEYGIKQTNYKDLDYGRTHDDRRDYSLTISFGNPKDFRITGLANYEIIDFDQKYRTIATGGNPLPDGPTNATNFNWSTKNTQINRMWGLIADWVPTERLALKGSYIFTTTGGGVHFDSANTSGAGGFNGGPLVDYVTDNTKKQTLNLKGDYKFDKQWTGTLGYVTEKYDYNDDQMKSYQGFYPYYQNLGGTNNSWYTGAYANPSYKLTVVYMTATYKF